MELTVELKADVQAGKAVAWVAHTNRFHLPGWAGTAIGEGPSPTEALTALGRELERILDEAYPPTETLRVDLERTHVHADSQHKDPESDRVFCACGAWRLADSPHWAEPRGG
jgi:hypothetical protein